MSLPPVQRTRPELSAARAHWRERLAPLVVPAIVAVVAVGIALRVWSHSALWLDEAQSVAFAQLPLGDLHGALKTDGAPPLYYVLLHFWLDVFGDSVWAARSMSMLASVAALPLAYLVGRRLGGTRLHGQLALVVFAANPWMIRYAGEARMYSLVALLVLVGMLALDWLRRSNGPWPVVALAGTTAALLLTHYWAIFLLATVGLALLVRAWRHPHARPLVRRALLGITAGGVLFLPWVPTMLYQSAHTGAPWATRPDIGSLFELPLDWGGGGGPVGRVLGTAIIPLILLAVFARRRPGSSTVTAIRPVGATAGIGIVVGGTLVLALVVSMATSGAVVGRYTAVVVPMVLLLVAFGIRTLPPGVGVATLATVVVFGLLGGLTIARTTHTHAGRVAAALNEQAAPGDLLVYCPDQLAPGVEARLEVAAVDRLTLPRQMNPSVVDWTDYTERIDALKLRRVAEEIAAVVRGETGSSVWLISGDGYRTHTAVCDPLRTRLVALLGVPATVLTDGARGHEKAALERFSR